MTFAKIKSDPKNPKQDTKTPRKHQGTIKELDSDICETCFKSFKEKGKSDLGSEEDGCYYEIKDGQKVMFVKT